MNLHKKILIAVSLSVVFVVLALAPWLWFDEKGRFDDRNIINKIIDGKKSIKVK